MCETKLNVVTHKMCDIPINTLSVTTQEALVRETVPGIAKWSNICIYPKDKYGWFIYLTPEVVFDEPNMPEDLLKVIRLAQKYDCDVICIDADASFEA